jgi:hypothetical protein
MFVFVIYGIGDVMISVLALIVLDRGFEPLADQTKDYKIGKTNIRSTVPQIG